MSTEREIANLGGLMNRIASILTGLALAVLFFVASAHAQSDGHRITANIPFEFTVGSISLPAGQYEFLRAGAGGNIVQVRGVDLRSRFFLVSAWIQENGLPEKSMLKFATVNGHHVLVQIWNGRSASGTELRYEHTSAELAEPPTIHGTAAN
jgi:hypothetical protein